MGRFQVRKPSAAMVVSMLALIVALGGTSLAATAVFSPKEKKQIKKISRMEANSQIAKRASGLSVKSALSASSATTAGSADSAKSADTAKTAESAKTAQSADTASVASIGAPRAYAEIEGDATVDNGSPSRGITDANVSRPEPGVYCFDLPFQPVTAAANGNPDTASINDDAILNFRLDDADFEFCPASAEAEVGYIDASDAVLQSDDFNIQFDG